MFALGCIQAMQCNKDSCPTGITTHNERLQRGLNVADKAQRVANYNKYIHYGNNFQYRQKSFHLYRCSL